MRHVTRGAALAAILTAASGGMRAGSAQDDDRLTVPDGRIVGIEEAVRIALDGSRELAAARFGIAEASGFVSEAWSAALPTVDLNSSFTRNINAAVNFLPARVFDSSAGEDDYLAVRFGADNQWSSGLSVEQALFRPELLSIGAASRLEDLEYESVRGQEQAVVTQVRLAYYALLLAEERLRLSQESLARVEASLEETQARFEAGFVERYDVLRLEVEVATLRPRLVDAENERNSAERNLAAAMDYGFDGGLGVTGSLSEIDLETPHANTPENRALLEFAGSEAGSEIEPLFSTSRELRSDLRQLDITGDLTRAELRLEKLKYLPSITLFGNYAVSAQDNGSPNFFARGDGQRAWSQFAGIRVSIPVFRGLSRDARIDQKAALVRQADELRERAVDVARLELTTLHEDALGARSRAIGQRAAVALAELAFEIAQNSYEEGVADRLDLIDAELALRESEVSYAEAVHDYLVARAQLDHAAGTVPLVNADPLTSNR